jgi:hypothetical protein
VRKDIAVPVSGLALFVANNILATNERKVSFMSGSNLSHYSFVMNKSFGATLTLVPLSLGATLSNIRKVSSM